MVDAEELAVWIGAMRSRLASTRLPYRTGDRVATAASVGNRWELGKIQTGR